MHLDLQEQKQNQPTSEQKAFSTMLNMEQQTSSTSGKECVNAVCCHPASVQFSSFQSLSHVQLFATSGTAAHQASLSITNSRSLPKLMSLELVMPSNRLILHRPLLLLPSIFPSIKVFSNESALSIRWPKYWSFSLNISPSNEHPGLISFRMDWLDLLAVQGTRKSSPAPQFKHQFFHGLSLQSNSHIHT